MGIFTLVWLAVSLTFVYLVCDMKRMRKNHFFFSLVITITSFFLMVGWWSTTKGGVEFSQFNGLMNSIFFCDYGIPPISRQVFSLSFLFPYLFRKKILSLRSHVQYILQKKGHDIQSYHHRYRNRLYRCAE